MPAANAGYSGTPLLAKLGVRDGKRLALLAAPDGFADSIQPLPAGAALVARGTADVIVAFAVTRKDLRAALDRGMKRMPTDGGMLWIAWPKRASKVPTELDENSIRDAALAAGLVDTKVCAIDDVWSGLRLSRRRAT